MSITVVAVLAVEVLLFSALAAAACYHFARIRSVWAVPLFIIFGIALIVGPGWFFYWQAELIWKTNPLDAFVVCLLTYCALFVIFSHSVVLPLLRRERSGSTITVDSERRTPEMTKRAGYVFLGVSALFCWAGLRLIRVARLPSDPVEPSLIGWFALIISVVLFFLAIRALRSCRWPDSNRHGPFKPNGF